MTGTENNEDRKKLVGLLEFARGVLNARSTVQMEMEKTGFGVFHESVIRDLPGVQLNCEDGAWLRLKRQRVSRPPLPPGRVAQFASISNPDVQPQLKPAISIEITREEADNLKETGRVRDEDIHPIDVDSSEDEDRVRAVLHAENDPELQRDFGVYIGGNWAAWAAQEKPVQQAIALYNDLFKIHSAIHVPEGTPPELVWGVGVGRWKVSQKRIDMPLIELLVDIEIEDDGAIAIRPRDLAPRLSLKPYLEIDVDGAPALEHELREGLAKLQRGEIEFSPFTFVWEPLLAIAASKLASHAVHVNRDMLEAGDTLEVPGKDLRIASSWALFGRPRSREARVEDLDTLRRRIKDDTADLPASIRGYAATLPETPAGDVSAFGLDSSVLGGATAKSWEPTSISGMAASSSGDDAEGHRVHFFPLPFNEEQGRISDMIDRPDLHTVVVSGPPGTGKSHSIANIISHQMALGKRVLVTARTPEAIAAVREKVPESLRSLVIASTGTDRESSRQLQNAMTTLTREVQGLDIEETQRRKADLEDQILECDRRSRASDQELAEIARANLSQLKWSGSNHTPMELVDALADQAATYDWFKDRPENAPPAQIDAVLARLKGELPAYAADIIYAGADLPKPGDLPTTAEIIAAHEAECDWNANKVDYSDAPTMVLDTVDDEDRARRALLEIDVLSAFIGEADAAMQALTRYALQDGAPSGRGALEAVQAFIGALKGLDAIAAVRFDIAECDPQKFRQAVQRGMAGQKPAGFSLFNGALKSAVGSVRVQDKIPSGRGDWETVLAALRLEETRHEIADALHPLVSEGLVSEAPEHPWDLAAHLRSRQSEIAGALAITGRIKPVLDELRRLFPLGLDIDAIAVTLDFAAAAFAIRGNLLHDHLIPDAVTQLREIAGSRTLPVLADLRTLADAIGKSDTDGSAIVTARKELTQELNRLAQRAPHLADLGRDLDALVAAGAPEWAAQLRKTPEAAAGLIPNTWRDAWIWAQMKVRIDRIIALGNGDNHRRNKSDAMARRRQLFEELIRTRTLLGLKGRMTKPIAQAMQAFTDAVSKIGTGRGKRAPRFIRAARDAAKQASLAAPIWIMPEYKIPEQLPAELGDFDLVILDEASQSDVTALAALARGKKILVVGDEEQVSPSVVGIPEQKINALRAQFLDGLPNASLIDQNASIFEITKRMHPNAHVMLREHFRCVAPIIQFSTRYYDNALVPLRVPKASERFDPPLLDVFIPGAVRTGMTNASEARWIVEEIAQLIKDPDHAGHDIGVISLIGKQQAEEIGRMLVDDMRVGPEEIKRRRIICGDARTMQGQERSIVFLSMVATPGDVRAQTTRGDQQRINVAMSRARDRLYLVRSVSRENLKPTDIKAAILDHFVDPMRGGRVITGKESGALLDRCQSNFEREVLQKILDANYRVRSQVAAGGFWIDLVVEGAEDRRLAIELDGDRFHGPDVWDQDMARQSALERAGWVFWRVFGSQWRRDPDYWWRDLVGTLDQLEIKPIGAVALDERFAETIHVNPVDLTPQSEATTDTEGDDRSSDLEDSQLGDFIEDKQAMLPLESAIQSSLKETTCRVLATLTPREERVLRLRFGIGVPSENTLEEVGREFQVTRERIRQIEAKALRKLKNPSRGRNLRTYLEE